MKVIATWLWPTQARVQAQSHNRQCHDGFPCAMIEVDETSLNLEELVPPRYKVICKECKEAEDEGTR